MEKNKLILPAAVILIALAAGGFILWQNVTQKPEVKVTGIDYRIEDKISVLGVEIPTNITLITELEVYNPNIIPLTITDAKYQVYLNDVPLGNGSLKKPVEIQPKSKGKATAEASISSLSGIRGALGSIQIGTMKAGISGEVYLKLPVVGVRAFPIKEEKEIKIN